MSSGLLQAAVVIALCVCGALAATEIDTQPQQIHLSYGGKPSFQL